MLIYTGNIGSKLASGELFAYAEVLEMMKVLWEEVSRNHARVSEASWWSTTCSRVGWRETLLCPVMAELTKG